MNPAWRIWASKKPVEEAQSVNRATVRLRPIFMAWLQAVMERDGPQMGTVRPASNSARSKETGGALRGEKGLRSCRSFN